LLNQRSIKVSSESKLNIRTIPNLWTGGILSITDAVNIPELPDIWVPFAVNKYRVIQLLHRINDPKTVAITLYSSKKLTTPLFWSRVSKVGSLNKAGVNMCKQNYWRSTQQDRARRTMALNNYIHSHIKL
jgi:hypothetical protein